MGAAPAVRPIGSRPTSAARSPTSSTATTTGDRPHRAGASRSRRDTTPARFERGVLACDGARRGLACDDIAFFAHGTTVVINALTERKGAKTGLITTAGFRDVLEIARGNRPDLFNFVFSKPAPFVPRHLRREIAERMNHRGEVSRRSTRASSRRSSRISRRKASRRSRSACSTPTPTRRTRTRPRRRCAGSGPSSARPRLASRSRANGASTSAPPPPCCPPMCIRARRAISAARATVSRSPGCDCPIYIMQSNGGVATRAGAAPNPINMVESGPASGMLGAIALGRIIGGAEPDRPRHRRHDREVLADRGRRARASPPTTSSNGRAPMRAIRSRCRCSTWSRSATAAAASPGSTRAGSSMSGRAAPARCPGRPSTAAAATEPTVTDANLIAGRINPGTVPRGQGRARHGERSARLRAARRPPRRRRSRRARAA